MSGQQLATTDHNNPPDVTATLEERRGLKLPAFPVVTASTDPVPPPGSAKVAPTIERDLPRAGKEATGNLRRFPLASSRPRTSRDHPAAGAPLAEVVSDAATVPTQAAPIRARRSILPATPAEPQAIVQEVLAPAGPPLTGEGSIIDRKAPMPTPGIAATPTTIQQTPQQRRLSAALPDSPAMFACVLLLVGALVLVWTFATHPPHPYGAFLFLNALGLGLAGGLLYGLSTMRARRERRRAMDNRRRP